MTCEYGTYGCAGKGDKHACFAGDRLTRCGVCGKYFVNRLAHECPGLPEFSAVGVKDDSGKPRWDLLPPVALGLVVDVLTHGASKYAPENWRKVDGWRWRYFRAALGHLWDWWRGNRFDDGPKGSGLPHLAHAVCCVLFLLEFTEEKKEDTK